jgi:RNA 3'-terminal phosphate cyclase (ATP)
MIAIDGAMGEGGGQVLRTALALSLGTRTPFRIDNIRAGRAKPGLLRQHLTAVRAAAAVGRAEVEGAELGSSHLVFHPTALCPGEYRFAVGTAGSATLVLQAILAPLLLAPAPSSVILEGGTHNPMAPPFDFLARALLPLLRRMGARVEARLERAGFYPAGGGRFTVAIQPPGPLVPLALPARGAHHVTRARAIVANLPRHIAERELRVVERTAGLPASALAVEVIDDGRGPGNVVMIEVEAEHVTEVFTGFGERNVAAEAVAASAVTELRRYLAASAPVGRCLADQLLVPMVLARGGCFRTLAATRHTTTTIEVIRQLTGIEITPSRAARDDVQIDVPALTPAAQAADPSG